MKNLLLAAIAIALALTVSTAPAHAENAADCPNGGVVRFGVVPYDVAPKLGPIYDHMSKILAAKLGCEVQVFVATNYNAEIEAMRGDKLEMGEFGPLGYVLAHQVAHADAVAAYGDAHGEPATYRAGIAVMPQSGLTTLEALKGHSFAFSDPASTSGYLFPSLALRKAGLDPKTDVRGIFAGSHTAALEALRNHKVEAAELNSQQEESAVQRGVYHEGDLVFLWKSEPLPLDPIALRRTMPDGFKQRLTAILQSLDLSDLPDADLKIVGAKGARLVPQTDQAYDPVRELVTTLNIDLAKLD